MTHTHTPKPGTVKWMAANGHPGYSAAFARRVAAIMAAHPDISMSEAIHGRRPVYFAV